MKAMFINKGGLFIHKDDRMIKHGEKFESEINDIPKCFNIVPMDSKAFQEAIAEELEKELKSESILSLDPMEIEEDLEEDILDVDFEEDLEESYEIVKSSKRYKWNVMNNITGVPVNDKPLTKIKAQELLKTLE